MSLLSRQKRKSASPSWARGANFACPAAQTTACSFPSERYIRRMLSGSAKSTLTVELRRLAEMISLPADKAVTTARPMVPFAPITRIRMGGLLSATNRWADDPGRTLLKANHSGVSGRFYPFGSDRLTTSGRFIPGETRGIDAQRCEVND